MQDNTIELTGPQSEIFESTSTVNLFLAGYGSGKSNLAGVISYNYVSRFPKAKGFIAANTNNQLNTSTMARVLEVWSLFGLKKDTDYVIHKQPPSTFKTFHEFPKYNGIISFKNGHTIFIGSLDNAKAHDGKEFDYAFLDETKDSKEEDVKEIILGRLRGKEVPQTMLYILTSPAKVQWINEWFSLSDYKEEILTKIFEKDDYFCKTINDKTIVISSTYHNEQNLPDGYIEMLYQNNTAERAKALIYGNPFFTTGGEYFSSFSQIEHVGKTLYDASLPIHISFDQNVVPYTPAGIFQIKTIEGRMKVVMIEEIAMYHPNNTTEHVCRQIIRNYKEKHKQAVFVYGDATGNARKGLTANIKNHYDVIKKVLRPMLSNMSMRVGKFNEYNSKRREFMNLLFEGKLSFDIIFDDSCKLTKDDFIYIIQDVNGAKKMVKDKQGAEKYGHFSDLTEYFLVTVFANEFKRLNL